MIGDNGTEFKVMEIQRKQHIVLEEEMEGQFYIQLCPSRDFENRLPCKRLTRFSRKQRSHFNNPIEQSLGAHCWRVKINAVNCHQNISGQP